MKLACETAATGLGPAVRVRGTAGRIRTVQGCSYVNPTAVTGLIAQRNENKCFNREGGNWDPSDGCCQKRCTDEVNL